MGIADDTRAQSMGIARFILSLIAGVPVIWIVWKISTPILSGARATTNSTKANQATTWLEQGINWMPIWFLIVSFFGIVVLAIYQRELLR
jgi:hypothetical protein